MPLRRLVLVLSVIFNIIEGSFLDSTKTTGAERYDLNGTYYIIYLEKVSFLEAKVLCNIHHGNLIEIENNTIAKFLGRALAESAVDYGSLWIGGILRPGNRNKSSHYKWLKSGREIVVEGDTFPMKDYPFWVDKPLIATNQSYCVAVDRSGHQDVVIAHLSCSMRRPFICEQPNANESAKPIFIKPKFRGQHKVFHLFYGTFTWFEAFSFCRQSGYRLASLESNVDNGLILNRMRHARPDIESVWICGIYNEGSWRWVTNDIKIPLPSKPRPVTHELNEPPWLHENIIEDGCLLADIHICKEFVFLEADCLRKRSFLCEELTMDEEQPDLIQIGSSSLWISSKEETWNNAMKKCKTCFQSAVGKLVTLTKNLTETLATIHEGMTVTLKRDIRHIWIGGHVGERNDIDYFFWVDSKNYLNASLYKDIDKIEGPFKLEGQFKFEGKLVGGLISLCKPSNKSRFNTTSFECLNMDREDHKKFFMYGLNCDLKQHFICEVDKPTAVLKPECANPLHHLRSSET